MTTLKKIMTAVLWGGTAILLSGCGCGWGYPGLYRPYAYHQPPVQAMPHHSNYNGYGHNSY